MRSSSLSAYHSLNMALLRATKPLRVTLSFYGLSPCLHRCLKHTVAQGMAVHDVTDSDGITDGAYLWWF